MLEVDYSTQFGKLIETIDWSIELPVEWSDYFEQRGEVPSYADDERHNRRLKVRAYGALWFEKTLPSFQRASEPVGVYTRDFSRQGVGFLSPVEIYPEEQVRIALPTFWMQLHVVRTRRITSKCFEVGAILIHRHDPHLEAFDVAVKSPETASVA